MSEFTGESVLKADFDKKTINEATGKPFGQASDEVVNNQVKDWQSKETDVVGTEKPDDIRSLGSQLIDWVDTPTGLAVLSGLGLAAAAAGKSGIKSRQTSQAEPSPKVEPTFNTTQVQPQQQPQNKFSPPQGDVTDVASRPAGTPRLQIEGPTGVAPAAVAPTNTPSGPVAPTGIASPVQPPAAALPTKEERAHQSWVAEEQRKQQLHDKKMESIDTKQVKKAAETVQKNQGKPLSDIDNTILSNAKKVELDKSLEVQGLQKAKPAPVGNVAPVVSPAEAPPEGWRANYLKNKSNPIGPGGFNYLAGQYGPEKAKAIWEEQYGKKNVPYEKVIQDWSASKNPAIPLAEGAKPGGTVPRGPHVPEYIKGGASIEGMTRTGLAALGLLPVAKELSKGNYKNALNEAIPAMSMVAPALSLAASPLYTSSEEKDTLNSIKQRGFKSFKELEEYKDKIAGGRGVAPPSNYQK